MQKDPPKSPSEVRPADSRVRSQIIIQSLSKISELLHAYDSDLEITLCDGGLEIASPSRCMGAFMTFDCSGGEEMLCEQLEELEIGVQGLEKS